MPLNFGSYAKPIKQTTSLDDFDFIVLIFKSIDKSLTFNLNKTNCNKFLNQKRNLPPAVTQAAKTATSTAVETYFRDYIVPATGSTLRNKLLEKLKLAVSNDTSIIATDKQIFLDLATLATLPTFLSTLFLYVVHQNNETSKTSKKKVVDEIDVQMEVATTVATATSNFETESLLLAQMFYKCAMCGNNVVRQRNTNVVKDYTILEIYPQQPTASQTTALTSATRPTYALNSISNKVLVCRTPCEQNYLSACTVEDYNLILSRKRNGEQILAANSNVPRADVEAALTDIVTAISSQPLDQLNISLRHDPLVIDRKIGTDEFLLKGQIRYHVTQYYVFIEGLLKAASKTNASFVRRLTTNVQNASSQFEATDLSRSQIYEQVSAWIATLGGTTNKLACDILTSFFVQNCEVFYI